MSKASAGTLLGTIAGGAAGAYFGGPAGLGIGASTGGMLGGVLGGAFDEPPPVTPTYVDPSLYDTSGYDSISEDAKAKADAAARRGGPTANWGLDDQSRTLALQDRDRQMALADDLDAVLQGKRLSLADQQAKRAEIATANEAQQQAANARGGAGAQIAANRQAMTLGTANQLESAARYNELRAQEEAAARGQLGQILGQTRGQDLDLRKGDIGRSEFDVTAAQQNQAQNDAQQRFFEDLRYKGVAGAAQQNQAYGAAQQGAAGQVLGINAQREQAQSDRDAALTGKLVEAGAGYAAASQAGTKPQTASGGDSGGGGAPVTDEEWNTAWNANAPPTQDEWDSAWHQGGGKKWW